MNARKFMSMFLVVCMMLTLASCIQDDAKTPVLTESPTEVSTTNTIETPAPTLTEGIKPSSTPQVSTPTPTSFPGKIGIITNSIDQNELAYTVAESVVERYSNDKILHVIWPTGFTNETAIYRDTINYLCEKDVEVIIMNNTPDFLSKIFAELKESEHNTFFICCNPIEVEGFSILEIAKQSDIVLSVNWQSISLSMVQQARKMGAKTFIYYSYPIHINDPVFLQRRELIKQECVNLEVEFVDTTIPDPRMTGVSDVQQFILKDVPKKVAQYGKDTAFFSTNCAMQIPLIEAVVDECAIYPSSCHPSLYHGFPYALGIEDNGEIITQITEVLAKKNMLGRVSTWPVDPNMTFTEVAAEYAIKRLNGEVLQEGVDVEVLAQIMTDYAGVQVYLTPYTDLETGITYDNYLMMRMDYITFE